MDQKPKPQRLRIGPLRVFSTRAEHKQPAECKTLDAMMKDALDG